MPMTMKITTANGVIWRVAGIKSESVTIEMIGEIAGDHRMIENCQASAEDREARTTTQTKRTPKVEDEAATDEEEVVGLLAVSCSFSGPGVLLKINYLNVVRHAQF